MELQRLVARIFYYLCVVTLQYVAPMILVLYLALMYKTMGGGTWTGMIALLKLQFSLWSFATIKGRKSKLLSKIIIGHRKTKLEMRI